MRLVLTILKYLFLLWLVVTGVFLFVHRDMVGMMLKYNSLVIPAFYGEPANEAEAREQDIRYLRNLTKYDRSFSDAARVEFETVVDRLAANAASMSKAELYLGASEAAALADNGHTGTSARPLYREFNRIGVKLYWFADGLYVVRAHNDLSDLVGARLTAIEGRSVEDVVAALAKYAGGPPQWRKLYAPLHMESPEIMHAAGLAASPDALTVTIETAEGATSDVLLAGSNSPGQDELPTRRPWMVMKPMPLPDEGADWTLALSGAGDDVPMFLRDSDNMHYSAPLPGGHYLRTQITFDPDDETSLSQFYANSLQNYEDGSLDYLVIDLRFNPGGDYTRVLDFVQTAPAKVNEDGRLYIVVGPQTFSAAIVTAAMLKYYGGDKSMIVGTSMGDRAQFWAERGLPFELPNSKFYINYATGYHDWENGCTGHPYCYTLNEIHEVPAGSLEPVRLIDPTFADYAAGIDPIMDWILSEHVGE